MVGDSLEPGYLLWLWTIVVAGELIESLGQAAAGGKPNGQQHERKSTAECWNIGMYHKRIGSKKGVEDSEQPTWYIGTAQGSDL